MILKQIRLSAYFFEDQNVKGLLIFSGKSRKNIVWLIFFFHLMMNICNFFGFELRIKSTILKSVTVVRMLTLLRELWRLKLCWNFKKSSEINLFCWMIIIHVHIWFSYAKSQCLESHLRKFHTYGDFIIAGDVQQTLGLCIALDTLGYPWIGGVLIKPHL